MSHPLLHELANHQYLRLKLEEQFPNVDEETLLDTLEGMTNLHEMLAVVVRSQLDDRALAAALRARTRDMQERLARFEQRAEKKKEITTSVLERASPSCSSTEVFVVMSHPQLRVSLGKKGHTNVLRMFTKFDCAAQFQVPSVAARAGQQSQVLGNGMRVFQARRGGLARFYK